MNTKPKGLKEITVLLCVFNLLGFGGLTLYDSASAYYRYLVMFTTLVIGLSFIVLWFFWKGHNWARILVLIASVFALTNLFYLSVYSWPHRVIVFVQAILACSLIIWLHTKSIKEYFSGSSGS